MTEELTTIKVQLEDPNEAVSLLGNSDANIKILEAELNVSIITRGETVHVSGNENNVELFSHIIEQAALCHSQGNQHFRSRCHVRYSNGKKGNA